MARTEGVEAEEAAQQEKEVDYYEKQTTTDVEEQTHNVTIDDSVNKTANELSVSVEESHDSQRAPSAVQVCHRFIPEITLQRCFRGF